MELSSLDRDYVEKMLFLSIEKGSNDLKLSNPKYSNFVSIKKGTMDLVLSIVTEWDDFLLEPVTYQYVTSSDCVSWGLSTDEALSMAFENSSKLFTCSNRRLDELISTKVTVFESPTTYLLTNDVHFNGAAVIFTQPEVLEKIANQSEIKQIAILPLSKDAVLLVVINSEEEKNDLVTAYDEFVDYYDKDIGLSVSGGIIVYDDNIKMLNELKWYGEAYSPGLDENSHVLSIQR